VRDLEEQFLSREAQREEAFRREEEQQMTTSQASEHERNTQLRESEAGRERAFQCAQETRLTKSDWYAKTRDEVVELNRQARNRGCIELEAEMKSCFGMMFRSQEETFTKEESLREILVDKLVSSPRAIHRHCLTSLPRSLPPPIMRENMRQTS